MRDNYSRYHKTINKIHKKLKFNQYRIKQYKYFYGSRPGVLTRNFNHKTKML